MTLFNKPTGVMEDKGKKKHYSLVSNKKPIVCIQTGREIIVIISPTEIYRD